MPEDGVGVLVFVPGEEGGIYFDACDDGFWIEHGEHYDHFLSVGHGTPDCPITGPSEEAPYTHWHAIPAAPEPVAVAKGGVPPPLGAGGAEEVGA